MCSAAHWLPCVRGAGIASAMTEGLLIQITATAAYIVEVGNGLARSACYIYLRTEIGAHCLPLEGKVSATADG